MFSCFFILHPFFLLKETFKSLIPLYGLVAYHTITSFLMSCTSKPSFPTGGIIKAFHFLNVNALNPVHDHLRNLHVFLNPELVLPQIDGDYAHNPAITRIYFARGHYNAFS